MKRTLISGEGKSCAAVLLVFCSSVSNHLLLQGFFSTEIRLHSEKLLNRKNSSLSAKIFLSKLVDWKTNWSTVCTQADCCILRAVFSFITETKSKENFHLLSGKHGGNNLTKLLTKWLFLLHCWGQEPGFCEVLSSPWISRALSAVRA